MPAMGMKVATADTNGAAAIIPRPKDLPPVLKKQSAAAKYSTQIVPLDGLGADKATTKLGIGGRDDKTGQLLKWFAAWAAVLTLLWAATGVMVLNDRSELDGLRSELSLLRTDVQGLVRATNESRAAAESLRSELRQSRSVVAQLGAVSAGRNETRLREELEAEIQELRDELMELMDQRRRAQLQCGVGEYPTGVAEAPCAPCPANTFSSSGVSCLECPVGLHPDALASRCTADEDDVYVAPVLDYWLAISYVVDDLDWFANEDVQDGMLTAISTVLQIEREELVNEAMEPTTGQVVFEMVDQRTGPHNRTIAELHERVTYALWNAFFLDPIINITECGLALVEGTTSCVRSERLIAQSRFGGAVPPDTFAQALANSAGVPLDQVAITRYMQEVDGSIQLPGRLDEIDPALSYTAGPRNQIASALANVLGLDQSEVDIYAAEDWARGTLLPSGRRLQASFFEVVRVAYKINTEQDVSGNLTDLSFYGDLLSEINAQGDAYVQGPGQAPRIMELTPVDMIVGAPEYETTIEFQVLASGRTTGSMVEYSLRQPDFIKLINSSGLLSSVTINVTAKEIISKPIPPPPPPPPKILEADEVHSTNITAFQLSTTGDVHVQGKLSVQGNTSFFEHLAVDGGVAAESLELAAGLRAGGASFGGSVMMNRSLDVAAEATFERHVEVGSLATAGTTTLAGDVSLGASALDELTIRTRIASNALLFDADGSNGSLSIEFPDPPSSLETIQFPSESGVVLTTGSNIVKVGTLRAGSLGPGFGAAFVTDLVANGAAALHGNVTIGDTESDSIQIAGSVATPSLVFDEDANGVGMKLTFPDPSMGTRRDGTVGTVVESCAATDEFTCARSELNGTEASCTGAGACVYTAEVVEVLDSCVAVDLDVCANSNISMAEQNETLARNGCEGSGNFTRNCTFTPFDNETKAAATCVSWSAPLCTAIEQSRTGSHQMARDVTDHCGRTGAVGIATATCSSHHSDAYSCLHTHDCHADDSHNPWLIDSNEEVIGSSVSFELLTESWVTGMSFTSRIDRVDRFAAVSVTFSDGTSQLVHLQDDQEEHMYDIGPALTTEVVITAVSVYGTSIRPGALEIWFRAGTARENTCLSAANCRYTPAILPVEEACAAIHIEDCKYADIHQENQSLHRRRQNCEDAGKCTYTPPRLGHEISFPVESGTVLTTASQQSTLQSVGDVRRGSLGEGFGGAHVAHLTSDGFSRLNRDVVMGSSLFDGIEILGHISSPVLHHDVDSDGTGVFIHYPADVGTTSQHIAFPNETGVVLTDSSDVSSLTIVSGLVAGSLEPGFGDATVQTLHSTGHATFDRDVTLGSSRVSEIEISGVIQNENLVFAAGRCAFHLQKSLTGHVWDLDVCLDTDELPVASFIPVEEGAECEDMLVPGPILGLGATRVTAGVCVDYDGTIIYDHLTTEETCTKVSGYLIGCTLDNCVNHGSLEAAFEACKDLGPEQCGGVTSANEAHYETRAGVDVQESMELSWVMSCGGELTLSVPTLQTDSLIAFPAESGQLLTDTSENSSLTTVGALASGSLTSSFGSASVASFESRGECMLHHDVSIGTDLSDQLSINALITTETMVFGDEMTREDDSQCESVGMKPCNSPGRAIADCVPAERCNSLLTLHMPQYASSSSLRFPNENGTLLTTTSDSSALTQVGVLTRGSIGLGFGSITTANDVNLTDASAVLALEGTLIAMSSVRLGDEATDEVIVRGTVEVLDDEDGIVFGVDPLTGDTTIRGDLVLGGRMVTGSEFGTDEFNVTTINEYAPGKGVTVEGVLISEGAVPEFQADSIREIDGFDRGIDVDGVLVKDGRLYVNSLCLYGSKQEDPCALLGEMMLCRSADRTTAHCVPRTLCTTFYDVGGGVDSGDGCYEFDAGRESVSVSANTITSDKILDLSILNQDIADGAVTSRNTDFTTLVLEDFGPVGRLTPNDWVFGERCLDPDDFVLELLETETACTETVAPTTNVWLSDGACIATDADGMPIVLPEFTDEAACEFLTSDTGHTWDVEICLDTDDIAVASIVAVDEGSACSDMSIAPGVKATLITSGVCVASDGATVRHDLTSEDSCTTVTTSTGHEWYTVGVCASTLNLVVETVTQPLNGVVNAVSNEAGCETMTVASPNTWHTGWICLAPGNQALLDVTWLGGCEGTQILQAFTITNTGRPPDTSAEFTGNTETDILFKHQYQGEDTASDSAVIAVGTEGHTPFQGTYLQLSTAGGLGAGQGEMQKRLKISSQGDTTIYGGVLRVEGDILTGENSRNARIQLGDEDSDKLTIGAYLSQESLQVDPDGDGHNRFTLTFPRLETEHELIFPAESGTVLTSTSDFSSLKAVDKVSSGSLAPGFGRADVASFSSNADSSLLGDTSIGNEHGDSIAFTGFITTNYLTFDTDWDHQCLQIEFPDPSSLKDYVPGDYEFTQNEDAESSTYGSFLPGNAVPVEGGALVYVNDTITFSWARYDNLHLVSYSSNPAAECHAETQTACISGAINCGKGFFDTSIQAASCTGDDDGSGTSTACALNSDSSACAVDGGDCVYTPATNVLAMGGSYSMTFASESDVGTYCVGGRNYDTTKMTVRVRLNPTFGYSTIDVQVTDSNSIGQLTWTITDADGNAVLSAAGDSDHTTLNGHISVNPDGQNYTFTIEDRGDDGIRGGGGYTVLVDGVQVASGTSEFTGQNSNIWAGGFKNIASHTFPVKLGHLKHTVYRDETGKPGYPTGEYSTPHCTGNVTNTVTFPSEDGTLLVKHAGETHLDGDLYLGGQTADSVLVPGRFAGAISFNMDEEDDCCKDQTTAVITGSKALRFGGENYGKLDETIGEWCRDDDSWALASSVGEFANTCTTTVIEECEAANESQETCAAAGSCTFTGATSDTCTTTEIAECAAANSDQTACSDAGDCTFTAMVEATCLTTVVPECEAANADEATCEAAGACVFTPADGDVAAKCKTAIIVECATANANEGTCTDAGACSFTPAVEATCSTTVVPECEGASTDQSACDQVGACTFTPAIDAKCETTVVPECEPANLDEATCTGAGACTFLGACAQLVADLSNNGADCYVENPTWNGLAVDNCAASCGICAWDASCPGDDDGTGTNTACTLNADGSACAVEGGDCEYIPAYTAREPYTRRGFHITLGVMEPTRDVTVTLPLEDGMLLTTASEISGLKQLGSLNELEVVGASTFGGDVVLGTAAEDGSPTTVEFESIVHGAKAMTFDAGVEAASGPHVNICDPAANGGTTVCNARGDSGSSMFPESLAIDGVEGGAPPNRWLSSDSTPYHWFVVHLGSPHLVSRVRAWASRSNSEFGNICRSSIQYLPFVSGEYRTMDEAVEGMETSINSPVQWENYQASGGWETAFSTDELISGEMDVSFDTTVTTEAVRINMDMSWGCEDWDSTGLFEVQVYGLPERAYTSLTVAPPSRDRIITLPDESGTLLTDASSIPGMFGYTVLAMVDLPAMVELPDGATVVRIERSIDGNDGLFTWPSTPVEGQMLVVVNDDDNTITEAGVSELVAQVLTPNSKHLFFYVGGRWVSLI